MSRQYYDYSDLDTPFPSHYSINLRVTFDCGSVHHVTTSHCLEAFRDIFMGKTVHHTYYGKDTGARRSVVVAVDPR